MQKMLYNIIKKNDHLTHTSIPKERTDNMTYEEIFEKAKKQLLKAKISDITQTIAVQFNIIGEGHGSFYAKIVNGKMEVEPYNYWDNDISLNVFGGELLFALENKASDKLGFYGDSYKISILKPALMTIPKTRKKAENNANK